MQDYSVMQEMVEEMYESARAVYPEDVTRGYDRAVEFTVSEMKSEFGVDYDDPQVKEICIRFYAALCNMSASATDDGLDDWFGVMMMGAALGVPTE